MTLLQLVQLTERPREKREVSFPRSGREGAQFDQEGSQGFNAKFSLFRLANGQFGTFGTIFLIKDGGQQISLIVHKGNCFIHGSTQAIPCRRGNLWYRNGSSGWFIVLFQIILCHLMGQPLSLGTLIQNQTS